MKLFGRSKKDMLRQIEHAEQLIGSLESFLFIAGIDKPKSIAVHFAKQDVNEYRRKWK